jgi:hypothetical protein
MVTVGLSLKEISSCQPMDVQENNFNKHKSAQQTIKEKLARSSMARGQCASVGDRGS